MIQIRRTIGCSRLWRREKSKGQQCPFYNWVSKVPILAEYIGYKILLDRRKILWEFAFG